MGEAGHNPIELVIVEVKGQRFAVRIHSVREIRGWSASTRLPHAPAYVLGMMNLRGAVLPVVDFASRLGLGESTVGAASVVIVAEVGDAVAGLLVDAVCDILSEPADRIQAPPDVGSSMVAEFVEGVIMTDEGIVTLLSLDAVLPPAYALAS